VFLDAILVSLFGSAETSVALCEHTVENLAWHSPSVHANDVARPSELGLDDHGLNAGQPCTVKHFQVCHHVLPPQSHDGPQ